jgi:hypothetical protein
LKTIATTNPMEDSDDDCDRKIERFYTVLLPLISQRDRENMARIVIAKQFPSSLFPLLPFEGNMRNWNWDFGNIPKS